MKRFDRCPERGYLFALSAQGVFCAPYVKDGADVLCGGQPFDVSAYYEVHCFDSEMEYRVVRDPWGAGEGAEFVFSASDEAETDDAFVWKERQFLRPEYCAGSERTQIEVVNRFAYQEDDRPCLVGYRLRLV